MSLIRLSRSVVGGEEIKAVTRVLEAGFLGMGQEVLAFEQDIQRYLATDRTVLCVNTGTAALHLALEALEIGPGDEVLVPSITYIASFQAISATGATPVACDVHADDAFLDVDDAARRLTSRTRVIMPVHYASNASRLGEVYAFAQQHGLRVVEDAAHSFGCLWQDSKVGARGDIVCFSFDGIKNITSGEGGAVVTGDLVVAERIRDARLLGVEKDTEKRYAGERSWTFDVHHQGYRYHMSNLMAAIGREQLKKLERFGAHRKSCMEYYRQELEGTYGLSFLALDYHHIVPHICVVKVESGLRDSLMNELRTHHIECGIHYQPNHLLSYYALGYRLPTSEKLYSELLSLPLHAELTREEQNQVIAVVRKVLGYA